MRLKMGRVNKINRRRSVCERVSRVFPTMGLIYTGLMRTPRYLRRLIITSTPEWRRRMCTRLISPLRRSDASHSSCPIIDWRWKQWGSSWLQRVLPPVTTAAAAAARRDSFISRRVKSVLSWWLFFYFSFLSPYYTVVPHHTVHHRRRLTALLVPWR